VRDVPSGARRQHSPEASAGNHPLCPNSVEEMKVVEKVSGGGRRACCRTTGFDRIAGAVFAAREDDEE
jgi:hypothetical protein